MPISRRTSKFGTGTGRARRSMLAGVAIVALTASGISALATSPAAAAARHRFPAITAAKLAHQPASIGHRPHQERSASPRDGWQALVTRVKTHDPDALADRQRGVQRHHASTVRRELAHARLDSATARGAEFRPATATTGVITGYVTAAATSGGIEDVCVRAYPTDDDQDGATNCTDSDGYYNMHGLAPGTYRVFFDTEDASGDYLSEYYDGAFDRSSATLVTVAAGGTATVSEALSKGGSISGTVTDSGTHLPINDPDYLCAEARPSDPDSDSDSRSTCSFDASGHYTITGLAPGKWLVYFSDDGGRYVGQYYGGGRDSGSATQVTVGPGQSVSGINQALPVGGSITGTVKDATTNAPVGAGAVCVDAETSGDDDGGSSESACTNASGGYAITGLPTGTYIVRFESGDDSGTDYTDQYYNGVTSYDDATAVRVTQGAATSGINAVMARAARISGHVDSSTTHAALEDVCVRATSTTKPDADSYGRCTDSDGNYTITGLPADTYTVRFTDDDERYLDQYFDGVATSDKATPVTLTSGQQKTGVDAHMIIGGSIAGTVVDKTTSAPLSDVCVRVYSASDLEEDVSSACTDDDGTYSAGGLQSGSYVVQFVDYGQPYLSQYYDNQPDAQSATLVSVKAGAATSGVNAALVAGGSISGTVKNSSGQPLADVRVDFISVATGDRVDDTYTNDEENVGSYTSHGLPAGSYIVSFDPYGDYSAGQYYNGVTDIDAATPVTVTARQNTPGIDATLTETPQGGSISGAISDANGNLVAGYCAVAVTADGSYVSSACSDADEDESSNYYMSGLPAGTYYVKFVSSADDDSTALQWYDGKSSRATATPVTVTSGQQTSSINATLALGSISGTLIDAVTHKPVAGICVTAEGQTGFESRGCSDSHGSYTILGLLPDTYTLSTQARRYYFGNGESDEARYLLATFPGSISVTGTSMLTGKNLTLVAGATVSGHITDAATGSPLSNVCVVAVSTDGDTSSGTACTNEDGTYRTPGVPAGTYNIDFTNYGGRYIEQWYDGKPTQETAADLSLSLGTDRPSTDAGMILGGNVTGTITDATTHAAVPDACVTLYTSSGTVVGSGGCSSDDGTFASGGVAAGTYKARFAADGYADQYYSGKSSLAAATTFTVTVGQTTQHIDAQLTPSSGSPTGSTLHGKVTRSGPDTAVAGAVVQVCPVSGASSSSCVTVTTANNGDYSVAALHAGSYMTTVSPGPNDNEDLTAVAGPVALDGSNPLQQDIALEHGTPPPSGVTITGSGSQGASQGLPVLYWNDTTTLTASECAGGTVTYAAADDDGTFQTAGMTEGPPGTFAATVPALSPHHGHVVFTISVTCSGKETHTSFDAYIDPSGSVVDTSGDPVSGATLTIYRSASPDGDFTAVPNGSADLSPANRTNPDTTDAQGRFGWDVVAGYYRVRASKAGCTDNADTARSYAETGVLDIPPPVSNLKLVLRCATGGAASVTIKAPSKVRGVHTVTISGVATPSAAVQLFSGPTKKKLVAGPKQTPTSSGRYSFSVKIAKTTSWQVRESGGAEKSAVVRTTMVDKPSLAVKAGKRKATFTVTTNPKLAGAKVTLYRVVGKRLKLLAKLKTSKRGNVSRAISHLPRGKSRFVAAVASTSLVKGARTKVRQVIVS